MEAKASKHASKCEHACARARVCVCLQRGGISSGRLSAVNLGFSAVVK